MVNTCGLYCLYSSGSSTEYMNISVEYYRDQFSSLVYIKSHIDNVSLIITPI